jgi:hypothetical protein
VSEKPDQPAKPSDDDDPVPPSAYRLPPRKRTYFPPAEIISIFALCICLFAVIALKDSCATGVENMFKAFEVIDAGPAQPSAPAVPRP